VAKRHLNVANRHLNVANGFVSKYLQIRLSWTKHYKNRVHLKKSKQDVKYIILVTKHALLPCHKKCGEWPNLFATNVLNSKILLDIVAVQSSLVVSLLETFSTGCHG